MKLLVLALAVVAIASSMPTVPDESQSICADENANVAGRNAATGEVEKFMSENVIMGKCPYFWADVMDSSHCETLYNEGYCYYSVAADRYGDFTAENTAEKLDFLFLKKGLKNTEKMGKYLCKHAEECYDHVESVFMGCLAYPEFADALNDEQDNYLTMAKDQLAKMQEENPDSALGKASEMILNYLGDKDVEQLKEEGEELLEEKDLKETFEEGLQEALETFQDFCAEDCVSKSADALAYGEKQGLLDYLIDDAECTALADFCDHCIDPANKFFGVDGNMPCCLKKVIDKGVEAADFLTEQFTEIVDVDTLKEAANEEEDEIIDLVTEQVGCIRETYETAMEGITYCVEEETAEEA